MLFNSGTFLCLCILAISAGVLLLFLLLLGVLGRKGNKLAGLKFLTLLIALVVTAASIVTPLVYFNYIDMNLKFGRFSNEGDNKTYLKFHRDEVSFHPNGQSEGIKGTWSLEKDVLIITYQDSKEEYIVKDFGTKLYQDDKLVYRYTKN